MPDEKKNHHILIIEDDPDYARLEQQALKEDFDFPVMVRQAWSQVSPVDVDEAVIVILDFNLPDSSGDQVVHELRKRTDIPIVIVSGNNDLETAVKTLTTGATEFLVKSPQTLILLPRIVKKALEQYETQKMLKHRELQRERRSAQVETLRQVLTTLAHYINNSTTTIFGYAQLCKQDMHDYERVKKLVQVSLKETKRITFVLQELEALVNNLELKTTSYVGIPEAMFAIEARIKEKMKKYLEESDQKKGKTDKYSEKTGENKKLDRN